jgi:hypothetical protein
MNSPRTGLRVASGIFAIFAIGHLLRLINHAEVTVGSYTIPMGLSWVALIVAAILCIWMWRLSNLAERATGIGPIPIGPGGPGG